MPTVGKTRSPSYPSLGLEEAIRKAEAIYDAYERKWVVAEVVAEKWEQSATSGAFMVALAAVKQFGLLEDEGRGPKRKFRVSDLAVEIILHKDDKDGEGADRRRTALKHAALLPKIHAELWTKFHGILPSLDNGIRVYLLSGRKTEGKGELFNKDAVDSLIGQFRSTVAFAGLDSSDKIPSADARKEEEKERVTMTKTPQNPSAGWPAAGLSPSAPSVAPMPEQKAESSPMIFFPLPGGNAVEIRLRSKISTKEFETLKALIDLSQASLVDLEKR